MTMGRKTSAFLASASSAVEVRDHHHEVGLGQRITLVYNMSILGNIQNYAFLCITAERTTSTIIPPPSKNFSHWPSQKSNKSESTAPIYVLWGLHIPIPYNVAAKPKVNFYSICICNTVQPFVVIFLDGGSKKRFSGFFGFPDQSVPENRMLPSGANPWSKRSPMTPQAWESVQPFRCDTAPIY